MDYAVETGPMGAIGESGSLMLRVNRNCPWNRCLFYPVYKNDAFSTRTVEEIKRDIDAVLGYMNKGVTGAEHIEAGHKLRQAGIAVAAFVMPGLGGHDPSQSKNHIAETVRVLNEMRPHEVRVRSLAILQSALLYQRWQSGEFTAPTEDQLVEELIALLEGIAFECAIETLQMTNPVISIKGPIGVKRGPALKQLAAYQALTPNERARFSLNRYIGGGYLKFVDDGGRLDQELERFIERAYDSAQSGAPDALERAEKAIFTLKSKGIP